MPDLIIGPPPAVFHIKQPTLPQFRFEWHPQTKKVYLIRVGATPEVGVRIADDCDDHAQGIRAVLCWCRGYKERDRELRFPNTLTPPKD